MFMRYNSHKNNVLKGFTLVEVLVATGIFMMTVIVLSQIYISTTRAEKVAYSILNADNNIRNNLEIIARAIRMGKDFEILDTKKICFKYWVDNIRQDTCYEFKDNNIFQEIGGSLPEALFDPTVEVTEAKFRLQGGGGNSQISIIILLEAKTTVREEAYNFRAETAVTPRNVHLFFSSF